MKLSIARALRLVVTIAGTAALAGCCGYLVSCPTTQTAFDSAGYGLSSLGNARDQAAGLLETSTREKVHAAVDDAVTRQLEDDGRLDVTMSLRLAIARV